MSHITLLTFTIVPRGRWGIGATESMRVIDRPVSTDPDDAIHVPATSLAGSLRAHLLALDPTLAVGLMGAEPGTARRRSDRTAAQRAEAQRDAAGAASALRLLGTRVEGVTRSLSKQTAIDRDTATAAEGTLRSSVVLQGGVITLFARIDRGLSEAELTALQTWVPVVGGRRSSGMGRCDLTQVRRRVLDLREPTDLGTFLREGGPSLHESAGTVSEIEPSDDAPWMSVDVEIVDGLLVAQDGRREDGKMQAQPFRRADGTHVIPGTSLRGVLRSRAEYILRSLDLPACRPDGPCGTGQAIDVDDLCLVCRMFGSTGYASPLQIGDADVQEVQLAERPHVAIDRVTGGARDGQLFSTQILAAGRFTIEIRVRPGALLPAPTRGLLRHVLRDIDDGLVGLGSRTTRGLGTVRIHDRDLVEGLADPDDEDQRRFAALMEVG